MAETVQDDLAADGGQVPSAVCEEPLCAVADASPTAQDRPQWIPIEERRPELGTTCIVWIVPQWHDALEPFADVDRWDEWRESPVSFSSATVVVGEGWMESDPAEVTHWMPLPEPPSSVPTVNALAAPAHEARPDDTTGAQS